MEYLKLGTSDLLISRVGFGCWAIGGHGYGIVNDSESKLAIKQALDCGINFFDTADIYGFGHSERVLSEGLGAKRHDVVIATKFGVCWDRNGKTYRCCNPERVRLALEESLRRLNIDCIPLYQIHWHDGVTPIEDTMGELFRCREAGKIRYIGCTNLSSEMIDSINRIEKMSSVQMSFNMVERENEQILRRLYDKEGMSTIAYGALMRGLLTGKYDWESSYGQNDTRANDSNFKGEQLRSHLEIVNRLQSIAHHYGRLPAQIALRWVLDCPFLSTVIVGMKTRNQVLDNAGADGWKLTEKDWFNLSNLSCKTACE
jgi:myo-inositol catabolism protein IolS